MFSRFEFVPRFGPVSGLGWAALGVGLFAWLHASAAIPFHYGAICGHGPAELHCAGCYVAAAMVATGLLAALARPDSRRLLRSARAA
jgi:hypothetical protein